MVNSFLHFYKMSNVNETSSICPKDSNIERIETVKSEEEKSLLVLCDDVLLKVIAYLEFGDVIKLSGTCTRLMQLTAMKTKRLDLTKCRWNKFSGCTKFACKEILTWVGPHIQELKLPIHIDTPMYEMIIQNCQKVELLDLSHIPYKDDKWNEWIKKLKLKRLSLQTSHNLNELFNSVTDLRELKIFDRFPSKDVWAFIEMNSNIERLSIRADYYGFPNDILLKLNRLQSLELRNIKKIEDLLELENYIKMDHLREFTIDANFGFAEFPILNKVLTMLSEKTNLHSLTITQIDYPLFVKVADGVIADIYRTLTSMKLVSLTLDVAFNLNDFINGNPSPNLKNLTLKRALLYISKTSRIVENWKNLEKLCIGWPSCQLFITKDWITNLLEISTSRPNLLLHFDKTSNVFYDNWEDKIVGIEIRFKEGSYRVIRETVEDKIGIGNRTLF